jgi:M6 family metalloprotease-like protein
MSHLQRCITFIMLICIVAGWGGMIAFGSANAMEPPPPGMIEQMRRDGTLASALESAKELGNYKMRMPKRGAAQLSASPQEIAAQIMGHYGAGLDAKAGKAVSDMTTKELSFAELDLNHDRVVDERDVLALGFPRPKATASLPSLGAQKAWCVFIDFPDYPKWFTPSQIDFRLFDQGDATYYYRSLQWYYQQASYNNLTLEGSVYQHRASHNRTYYHPNDNNTPYSAYEPQRKELLREAILAADAAGTDFSQYDNDGDGVVDYYLVIYCGPVGTWGSYWWAYCYSDGYSLDVSVDGVSFNQAVLSWQWEQDYGFAGSPPNAANFDPHSTIHETGHALGLPDYYRYADGSGPLGGVGTLDMMDGNWGDHNCFSKYVLGWLAPTVAFTNLNNEALDKSNALADAVVVMPGFDPVSPWSEYFMAQYRFRAGVDQTFPTDGMLLWHVDARVNEWGSFNWDNSYTSHKQLRLMEADGLEEIETGDHLADAGDYYKTGKTLSPASTPSSNKYGGAGSGITVNDFSAAGAQMTADFTAFTSNPPQVNITAPGAGSTVSGSSVSVTVTATDDNGVSKVQLLLDGQLVQTWSTWSSPSTYAWNTLVEFNKSVAITARAWDGENQVGSMTINVTVSNTGVTALNDTFESDLVNWRALNYPGEPRGSSTQWSTRTSPGTPVPLGSGKEAWVQPPADGIMYGAYETLRSQRINATAFTHPPRVKFYYRCYDGLELRASTDNGGTWTTLATIPASSNWATYDSHFASLKTQTFYLALHYVGGVQNNLETGLGANIDNFICQQLPSEPPTVDLTSPVNGATISGTTVFTATASDDGSVASVKFYLNNELKNTDLTAPYSYSRNTLTDDNHPALPVKAVAVDNDGIESLPDAISVVLRNTNKTYPVYEDLETNANWSTQNYAPTPDWTWVSNAGHSGTHSYGWVIGGGGDGATSDMVLYNGHADFAAAGVADPQLKFYYKGDLPPGATVHINFNNSWLGSVWIGSFNTDRAQWYETVVPMDDWLGYSGRVLWFIESSNVIGTGVWIDDLRVENNAPYINSISPTRGVVATTLTISGQAFGATRVAGSVVTFGGGVNAADADFVAWSNNQIRVKIPTGAVSGNITVTVASQTSNGVNVAVLLAPPSLQNLVQQ